MVIFGDGSQTRDFTFVSDTACGILLAGFADAAVGETLNLGQGQEISIKALAQEVARATGKSAAEIKYSQPRPGDVERLCADAQRAQQLLGFVPKVTLEEGLGRLVTWYQSLGQAPEVLLRNEVVHNWNPVV